LAILKIRPSFVALSLTEYIHTEAAGIDGIVVLFKPARYQSAILEPYTSDIISFDKFTVVLQKPNPVVLGLSPISVSTQPSGYLQEFVFKISVLFWATTKYSFA
jgi:hypothetical protein